MATSINLKLEVIKVGLGCYNAAELI